MSGRIKNCNPPFYVYHLVNEKYIGVTTNVFKRLIKHRNYNKRNVDYCEILKEFNDLDEALEYEYNMQIKLNYEVSNVRNQIGKNNPYSKTVLHTLTGVYYDSIKEACEAMNYNYASVRGYLKNKDNKYNLIRF